jgi:alpha-tubulin suppressor-like RCC1 family protein
MKTSSAVALACLLVLTFAPAAIAGERPRLIGTGEFFSCAMTENGNVLCWGKNASGQLGDDSTTQRLTPVAVNGLIAYWALAVGFDHACAIDDAGGRVRCWGNNSDGQLGNNSTTSSSHVVQVSGLTSGATAIAAGKAHTCAIASGAAT